MKTTKGLLIFNSCYASVEVIEHLDMFVKSFRKVGCELELTDNLRFGTLPNGQSAIFGADLSKINFALFYDKDIALSLALEQNGVNVFNSSRALKVCDDKYLTYQTLSGHNIPVPLTVSAPLVYKGFENLNSGFISFVEAELGYPMIIKQNAGSQGKQVYKCDNHSQLVNLRRTLLHTPHIYQEYIESSYGVDYRFYYIDGKILGAVKRICQNDFRSNISGGGRMELFDAPEKWTELAVRIGKALTLDFGTVDFLINKDGNPVFCEANSNTFFINYFKLSGINFADKIAEYIIGKTAERNR